MGSLTAPVNPSLYLKGWFSFYFLNIFWSHWACTASMNPSCLISHLVVVPDISVQHCENIHNFPVSELDCPPELSWLFKRFICRGILPSIVWDYMWDSTATNAMKGPAVLPQRHPTWMPLRLSMSGLARSTWIWIHRSASLFWPDSDLWENLYTTC
jgi:hypothetical protein